MPTPRRRLASEAARHGLCMLVVPVVLIVVPLLLHEPSGRRLYSSLVSMFVAWAAYGPVYLLLSLWAFRGLKGARLRVHLRASQLPRSWLVRALFGAGPRSWGVIVSGMAMVAVLGLTIFTRQDAPWWVPAAGIACVLGTWILLLGVFALEYARLWADDRSLRFPDDDDGRTITDFLYAAVQVSTTFSASDVAILGARARSAVMAHSLTAWAFTTVVIALVVSLAL